MFPAVTEAVGALEASTEVRVAVPWGMGRLPEGAGASLRGW